MKEAVLEPNESKKSKGGSEWAMSVGKMESNIASQSMQQSVRVLVFIFYTCMQQREVIRQGRCVRHDAESERNTMHTETTHKLHQICTCKL